MVDDLMITGSSTTSLQITWSLPQYGCSVVGYRIYYSMEDSLDERIFMYVSGGDITHTVIQDLRANTTYNVTVAVYINKDYELGESPAVEGSTMPCPANYEEGPNGHCYWFSVTPYGYMWYWGRQDCAEETDSDLVIVSDEEELDFLRSRVAELSGDDRDWWIGLSQSPYWSWVDCTESNPWQDTLWAPGNPRPDSYGCAVLNASGQIIDTGCDIKHHFICEIYPRGKMLYVPYSSCAF
nr:CD209 antigen-like protein D [Lytechinus pictus]